jgi:hypothetical protein
MPAGSRSPATMARMIRMPVAPLMSETTWCNCRFVSISAFRMCSSRCRTLVREEEALRWREAEKTSAGRRDHEGLSTTCPICMMLARRR